MSASLTSPDIVIVVIPESRSAFASSIPSTSFKHNYTAFTHDGQCMPTTLISFSAIINHLIIDMYSYVIALFKLLVTPNFFDFLQSLLEILYLVNDVE